MIMDYDERDELWKSTWEGFYNTSFQVILSERLLLRWKRFDDLSKILIAITTSGSAIAGWSLWTNDKFKLIWVLIAGLSAIIAVFQKSFDIPNKITEWKNSKDNFCILKMDYSNLMDKMKIDSDFNIDDLTKEYLDLNKKYAEVYKNISVDSFITRNLHKSIQKDLNSSLYLN
jgi:hypothetical protein